MATTGTGKATAKAPVPAGMIQAVYNVLKEAGEHGRTRQQLLDQADVSPRTLDRALQSLRADGARIDTASACVIGRRNFIYTMVKGPHWAEGLSHQARLAMQVAEIMLENAGTEFWSHYLKIFEGLLAPTMNKKEEALFNQLKDQVNIRGPRASTTKRDANVFLKILKALSGGDRPQELELTYRRAGDAMASQVKVLPFCITHDSLAASSYLLAWDVVQLRPRHFRLSRITGVKVGGLRNLPASSKRPLELARNYQVGGWFDDDEPFLIEVEVTEASWVKSFLDSPPDLPDVAVDDLTDSTGAKAKVSFKATELVGPTRWVMQLGPDAVVLSPPKLRKFVAGKLKAAAKRY